MDTFKIIGALPMSERIAVLKKEMLDESRYATIEQARIITKSYRQTEGQPRCIQRAKALKAALEEMTIRIEPHERIVGNRTPGVRGGVVFPETGASWVDREFETLPTRPQDRFQIHQEDVAEFRSEILGGSGARGCRPAGGCHLKGGQDQPEGSLAGAYLP